jgi:anti-anti-sigma regulatory factor
MPTNIVQIEDAETGKTILRVEGELTRMDAELLEKIALEMRGETGRNLTIDLADLHFLDSEGAPVLKRMADEHGFEIEGLLMFLQRAIEENEKRNLN